MINNFGLLASFKVSRPNAASVRATETSNGNTAERSNSFRDSLREAGNNINREDNRSIRKELVGRTEAKLNKANGKSTKVEENKSSEIETKDKQTEKISKRIEEILAVLQQLANLQQDAAVTPENQEALVEGIKEAFHELTALQSKLDKLAGTKNLQLQTELPELKQNIAEFRTTLEGIVDKLKAEGTESDSEASNFLQKLQTVIDETLPKLEVIVKTPTESSGVKTDDMRMNDTEAAVKTGTEADNRPKEANVQERAEAKVPVATTEEAAETAEAANKTDKKAPKADNTGIEATEEEISALEEKTEKISVQTKEDSKPENESASDRETSKEALPTAGVKQNKMTNEGITVVQQEQVLPVENTETASAQTAAPKAQNMNRAEIINQIVKKAEIVLSDTHSEMRMQLEPENLGKLTLKIAVERGLITAKFTAESYEVKKVIESSFNELRDMLQEKGLEVQNFSVTVGQENKEYNNNSAFQQWKETVRLNSSGRSRGSYEGYIGSEDDTPRAVNPYRVHNGEFDHIA